MKIDASRKSSDFAKTMRLVRGKSICGLSYPASRRVLEEAALSIFNNGSVEGCHSNQVLGGNGAWKQWGLEDKENNDGASYLDLGCDPSPDSRDLA